MDHFVAIVIGTGVVGLAVAQELARSRSLGARGFASAPMKKAPDFSEAFPFLKENGT